MAQVSMLFQTLAFYEVLWLAFAGLTFLPFLPCEMLWESLKIQEASVNSFPGPKY